MQRLHPFLAMAPLLAGSTLLLGGSTLLLAGCSTNTGARAPRPARSTPAPRVRESPVLRLSRAGVLVPLAGGGAAALLPSGQRAGGWRRAVDSQGNQFRVSPRGLLVTDGALHPERQPASVANVAYYYAQAYALMARGLRRQGLLMAAEVLDLPSSDPHVKLAQRSLCGLFLRLGIRGNVRRKLYRNLVGVAHRVPGGARVINHVHGFAVTAPLSWRILAAAGGQLGPGATIMAFSLPGVTGEGRGSNILWITRRIAASSTLARYARSRLLTTAGSVVRPLRLPTPARLGHALAFSVDPVKYRGRELRSVQLFFLRAGLVHHLNLLTASSSSPPPGGLQKLLKTFRLVIPPDPCR